MASFIPPNIGLPLRGDRPSLICPSFRVSELMEAPEDVLWHNLLEDSLVCGQQVAMFVVVSSEWILNSRSRDFPSFVMPLVVCFQLKSPIGQLFNRLLISVRNGGLALKQAVETVVGVLRVPVSSARVNLSLVLILRA